MLSRFLAPLAVAVAVAVAVAAAQPHHLSHGSHSRARHLDGEAEGAGGAMAACPPGSLVSSIPFNATLRPKICVWPAEQDRYVSGAILAGGLWDESGKKTSFF